MSSVNQDMSLFIPRVFPNITADYIKNCFQDLGLGQVERVDLVSKGEYNAAYVHFVLWNNNSFTSGFQYYAADPSEKCIMYYDGPWYWIVLENTSAKRVGPERRKETINIRPEFMDPLPFIIDEMTNADADLAADSLAADSLADAAERTVPFSVFEELIWDMEVMQGQINELEERIDAQEKKYLTREIQLKKIDDDILLLKEIILNSNVDLITDAVTGARYKRDMMIPAVFETTVIEDKKINNLVRETAQGTIPVIKRTMRSECESSFAEIAALYKPM